MDREIKIELKHDKVEDLLLYSKLLKKEINTLLDEALELYFKVENEKLLKRNENDENAMTNLSFEEFWDGIELSD